MYSKQTDIASLISSRICHDLVSPLGAITNGLELLELSGLPAGPEYDLLNESVANANARINFFRYAFGAHGYGNSLSESNIRTTLDGCYGGSRISVDWQVSGAVPRVQVKLALLIVQCLESFLPVGGTITVARTAADTWAITAADARLRPDEANLAHLLNGARRTDLKPSEIQFELARAILQDEQVRPETRTTETELALSYRFSAA